MENKGDNAFNTTPQADIDKLDIDEPLKMVQNLLQGMQDKFAAMSEGLISRIDEMGNRINELEQNISELMQKTEEFKETAQLPQPESNESNNTETN